MRWQGSGLPSKLRNSWVGTHRVRSDAETSSALRDPGSGRGPDLLGTYMHLQNLGSPITVPEKVTGFIARGSSWNPPLTSGRRHPMSPPPLFSRVVLNAAVLSFSFAMFVPVPSWGTTP